MSGWIKLHRSLLDWEWYRDIPVRIIFEHLLLTANFEDRNWKGQIISRGTLITSLSTLASETGLTNQQTRTALNKLKSTNNITIKATNKYQAVTIVNYGVYQDCETETTRTVTSEITNEQQTINTHSNKPITTTKESKNQEYNNIYNTPLTPQEGKNEAHEEISEKEKYAFEGEIVKLNENDFNRWKDAYPNVELKAFLTSYDNWIKGQPEEVKKEWFPRCSGYLAKKNQEVLNNSKPKSNINYPNKSQSQSGETIWDVYDRLGIHYSKTGENE